MIGAICMLLIAGWQIQTSTVSVDLYDVDRVSANECWVTGLAGTILHTTNAGASWAGQTSGITRDLYGVDFVDALNGWAVGSGPTILHTTNGGNTWTPQNPVTTNNLLNVAFVDLNRGWASGVTGTIMGTTDGGTTWRSELSGEWAWLWGLTAVSSNTAWAFGGDWFQNVAPIFYYNGTSWRKQIDITETKDGNGITAVNASVVFAVGGAGVIYYSSNSGTNWTRQTSGTTEGLRSIAAPTASSCWAVGSSGIILYTGNGGSSWSRQTSPVTDTLFGVTMWDLLRGWAVGKNGRILFTTDGGVDVVEMPSDFLHSPVSIYPNPVSSRLHLCCPKLSQKTVTVKLFDANGRLCSLLYQGKSAESLVFDLSGLANGVYFITLTSAEQRISRRFTKIDRPN